jgi:hypothetical protein
MAGQLIGLVRRLFAQDVSCLFGEGVNMRAKRMAYEKACGALPDTEEPYQWLNVPVTSTMNLCDLTFDSRVYAFADKLARDLDY